ncbi:PIG-L family deacetylase [Hymenobacter lapidiphilus]|uniref:PIG-L family deacetylase n=1 Tax=Hymenobacter sp. CCM 8763 TaxID=2303334 RepID=UPI0021CF8209|nr:PIG-L family deacetylase [Hymenobacter sp. CCM 8763]
MTELPAFNSTALPLQPAAYAATLGPTVVIAPHPDDESLGCGGLLALLARANVPVWCVLMSDGTMSHPNSAKFPAPPAWPCAKPSYGWLWPGWA